MLTRRSAVTLLAAAASPVARAAAASSDVAFYNAVGPTLAWWQVDIAAAGLMRRGSVDLPGLVQYAWRHPRLPVLYVASSNFVPMDQPSGQHHLTALRIHPVTGALRLLGAPVPIRARPINISVDLNGRFLLTAYNVPSMLSVHALLLNGAIGPEVKQTAPIDGGIYAHQVRVFPSNRALVLVTRGNNAAGGKPEDPGALKVKSLSATGQLADIASIAPNGGYGFGPRHVDFHPSGRWMYVSMERENQLQMFRITNGELEAQPAFVVTTLADPAHLHPEQMVGPIHVHPDGRFVYLGNRASGTVDGPGQKVAAGGENSIAVFAIDPKSGAPRMVQTIDTHGFHPRTFSLDPSGRMLVVANLIALPVAEGGAVRMQPATLSTYHVGAGGGLRYVRSYDIETDGKLQFWSGFVRT